ncbi:MAG: energy-coupling factor transporter transmembrane component T [candidate division WOR-3 bacterium]
MNFAYYPKNSIIHSLDPRSKLFFAFSTFIFILLLKNIYSYFLLLLFIIFPFSFSKLPIKKLLKNFLPLFGLILITFLFHLFLTPGKILLKLGFLNATLEGLQKGFFYSLRITLLIFSSTFVGLTTSPIDLADSLSPFFSRLKSKTLRDFPMIMIFTLRFVPFMFQEGKRIILAQKARFGNIRINKNLISLIFPIIHSSIRKAETLALALHAKAYQVGEKRITLREFRLSWKDFLFMIYALFPLFILFLEKKFL